MESENGNEFSFITPFGFKEEVFMRSVAKGNYTPTVHEIEDLIINKKVTFNEARVLYFIKSKTVDFRNTHVRLKRKDIAIGLKLDQGDTYRAIKSLTKQQYLLEKEDSENYFFYALHPVTFGGIIVLRSKAEVASRLNVSEKRRLGISPKSHGKTPLSVWEKAIEVMGKHHREDESIIRNYSGFEMLKYTLLKYILLNGISAGKSQEIVKLLEGTQNPEYMIKQFTCLFQKHPSSSRGIVEEFLRAHREGTDANGHAIKKNAAAYLIASWDQVKHHWQNLDHHIDMDVQSVANRKEIFDLIQSYPIKDNVVSMKRAEGEAS